MIDIIIGKLIMKHSQGQLFKFFSSVDIKNTIDAGFLCEVFDLWNF